MHENVDISKELQETRQMFDSVLLAMGSQVGPQAFYVELYPTVVCVHVHFEVANTAGTAYFYHKPCNQASESQAVLQFS